MMPKLPVPIPKAWPGSTVEWCDLLHVVRDHCPAHRMAQWLTCECPMHRHLQSGKASTYRAIHDVSLRRERIIHSEWHLEDTAEV